MYNYQLLIGKGEKRPIENTAFYEGSVESNGTFQSKYRKKLNLPGDVNPLGIQVNALSYKIVRGIVDTQLDNFNVYYGVQNKHEFYLGVFFGGSANQYDMILLEETKDGVHVSATNVYTHFLVTMMLIRERHQYKLGLGENKNKELDTVFRSLSQEGYIDANQKKTVFILNDNLMGIFKRDICNHYHCTGMDDTEVQEYVKNYRDKIVSDVTSFRLSQGTMAVNPEGKIAASDSAKYFNIPAMKGEMPDEIGDETSSPVNREAQLKKKYWDGIKMFTKKEISKMPLLLRNGYEMAQQAFLQNREFFRDQEWDLIDAIACGDVHSINFNGPAGVGKTTTIRAMAGALGMPFVLVGGSANIEEADLLGTRNVEAQDGVSVTTWTDGPITSAIRYGAFLLFDEVNSADPGILMKLNTILDGSKSLILSTAEEVKVHPKFVYSEAMNVGAGYNGTDMLNQSHLDRCDEIFKITARDVEDEAKIIASATGYENMENLKKVCKTKAYISDLIRNEGDDSEQITSPRRLICWVKKAKRTNEWIESSLSTVIAHLTVYDDSVQTLTVEEVLGSNGIAASAMVYIMEQFKDVPYIEEEE